MVLYLDKDKISIGGEGLKWFFVLYLVLRFLLFCFLDWIFLFYVRVVLTFILNVGFSYIFIVCSCFWKVEVG